MSPIFTLRGFATKLSPILLAASALATPLVHWKLDDAAGSSSAADSSGNSRPGTVRIGSGVVFGQAGKLGSCVQFNNTAGASIVTKSPGISGYPFTVSLWISNSTADNDTVATLGTGNSGVYHALHRSGNLVERNPATFQNPSVAASGVTVSNGAWHHVVGVWESVSSRRLYVDGILRGTDSDAGVNHDTATGGLALDRFAVGALDRTDTSIVDNYTGLLDDAALFGSALSDADVAVLYGAANSLGLDASEVETLRSGFASSERVVLRGAVWSRVSGLSGTAGTVTGTLAAGNATVVMDGAGSGMKVETNPVPVVLSFSSTAPRVAPGFPIVLNWNTFGADSVSISPVPGAVAASGSATVAAATSYTLTATNTFGTSTKTITLDVSPVPVHPVITEFLADNGGSLRDDDGAASDWIELENRSTYTLSTAGYALTDDVSLPNKFPLPTLTLAPGQRLLVWASGKNRSNPPAPLHASFSLSATGEYLALTRNGSETIQAFAPFPEQFDDVSYGLPAGSDVPAYLSPVTPGSANPAVGYLGLLTDKPVFSIPGGVFATTPGSLVLTHTNPAATIRYTLDGSVPTEASPAHTAPLPITSTILVTARAFLPGYLPGPVRQFTYAFSDASVKAFASSLPVVVLDTQGTVLLDDGSNEARATMALYEPDALTGQTSLAGTPTFCGSALVHIRGQTSSGYPKKPFDIELNENEGLLGMPSDSDWILNAQYNDRALVRDSLAQKLWSDLGYYGVRGKPVEVYVNSSGGPVTSAHYVGLYLLQEDLKRGDSRVNVAKLDATMTSEPLITGGYIFSADKIDAGDIQISGGDGNFIVREPRLPNTAQTNWLSVHLNEFHTVLSGPNAADPFNGYAKYLDATEWVDYHILREMSKEVDSFVFSCHYFKDRGGKIMMGPQWDFDRAWGNSNQTLTASANAMTDPSKWVSSGVPDGGPGARGRYWSKLFADADFRQLWIDRWQKHLDGTLAPANFNAVVDSLVARNDSAAVARNFTRWNNLTAPAGASPHSFATYADAVAQLKSFHAQRATWVASQFTARPTFGTPAGTFNGNLTLTLSGPAGATVYYTTDGSDPRAPGGSPRGTAYSSGFGLTASTVVTARALLGSEWSGPVTGTFTPAALASASSLVVSELNYHPALATAAESAAGVLDAEQFEFVELLNVSPGPVDLSGVAFTTGLSYAFPSGRILAAGERIVLARNPAAFAVRYPDSAFPGLSARTVGPFASGALDNAGERLVLSGPSGVIADLTYDDNAPWPDSPDGAGATLVFTNVSPASADKSLASNWFAHTTVNGNPGGPDLATFAGFAAALGVSADTSDSDHDGLSNLAEYALGSDAASPSSSALPRSSILLVNDGLNPPADYLTLSFTRRPGVADVSFVVESSADVSTWSADAVLVSRVTGPDGTETLTYRSSAAVSAHNRRFLRVRLVTLP